jgi:arylsulfatase A-like enzyme
VPRSVSRRQFLRTTGAAAAGLAAPAGRLGAAGRHAKNVILVVCDTLRRDALGCYGGRWVQTPHLDAFARTAVRCDHAYLCSFPTVPARHDLLTGQYTFTFKPWSPLDRDTVTLQDALCGAGVYTALVADTPHPFRPGYGYQRNFDFVLINRGQENDEYRTSPAPAPLRCDPRKLRNGDKVVTQYLRNVADRRVEEDYFCARTMRAAADWLAKNHRRQPFFLYVDTFDPHEPWDPPKSYVDRYDPGYDGDEVIYPRYDRWKEFLTEKELKHCRALYAGEVSLVDRWVGHLLERVGKLGLLDNTVVIVTADHGFYLGEHGYVGKSFIRGDQYQSLPLYGEVCRVPLLVHYPGCEPGSVRDGLVQTVHLAPTVLDFLERPIPESFQAPSAWRMLRGKEEKGRDVVISSPTLSHAGMKRPQPSNRATVSDGRWLLVYGPPGSGDPDDRTASVDSEQRRVAPLTGEKLAPELYDLQADPGCVTNLAAKEKARAIDLHQRFVEFLVHSPMRPGHAELFRTIRFG